MQCNVERNIVDLVAEELVLLENELNADSNRPEQALDIIHRAESLAGVVRLLLEEIANESTWQPPAVLKLGEE